jgi:hypothetical protein
MTMTTTEGVTNELLDTDYMGGFKVKLIHWFKLIFLRRAGIPRDAYAVRWRSQSLKPGRY